MSAQHTPAGALEISLRIGQRVRHHDHLGQRVTGVVHGLSIDSDRVLQADIVLDAPIIIPALSADDREISIWRQHVPAHELAPFDERDELLAELADACKCLLDDMGQPDDGCEANLMARCRSVIAKVNGSVQHQGMTIAGDGASMLGKLMREQYASRGGVYPDGNPNVAIAKADEGAQS